MTGRAVPRAITFRAVDDDPAGAVLAGIFAEYWPAYQRWLGVNGGAGAEERVARLREHMPELVPVFERLLGTFGGGDDVASFLCLYNPPRVVRGCSQVVLDDDGPVLLRAATTITPLLDDLVLRSRWLGKSTIAMTDCMWGALDGINESGLAVALAFGGRDAIGPGFAAPLVVRYLLETCATVADAERVLARIPVYMPYTFVVADSAGAFVTAYTGPDIPTRCVTRRASTNHQTAIDWPAYCRHSQSEERLGVLESLLGQPASATEAIDLFMKPPLWQSDYPHAAGTLYVAEYRPCARALTLHWPGLQEHFSVDAFEERAFTVGLQPAIHSDPASSGS